MAEQNWAADIYRDLPRIKLQRERDEALARAERAEREMYYWTDRKAEKAEAERDEALRQAWRNYRGLREISTLLEGYECKPDGPDPEEADD